MCSNLSDLLVACVGLCGILAFIGVMGSFCTLQLRMPKQQKGLATLIWWMLLPIIISTFVAVCMLYAIYNVANS